MRQRKTRGRKNYYRISVTPNGRVKELLPRCVWEWHAEGDTTFDHKPGHHPPRKTKKWIRKELNMGVWQPWWTSHRTRSAVVPAGILRTR